MVEKTVSLALQTDIVKLSATLTLEKVRGHFNQNHFFSPWWLVQPCVARTCMHASLGKLSLLKYTLCWADMPIYSKRLLWRQMSETRMSYYAHELPFWQTLCFVLFCFVFFVLVTSSSSSERGWCFLVQPPKHKQNSYHVWPCLQWRLHNILCKKINITCHR